MMVCCATTLNGFELSLKARLRNLALITASFFLLTALNMIALFWSTGVSLTAFLVILPSAFVLGLLVSRGIMLHLVVEEKKCGSQVCNTLLLYDFAVFEKILEE